MFLTRNNTPFTGMLHSAVKKSFSTVSVSPSASIKILKGIPSDKTVPQFTVGRKNGFLPWGTPLARLPEQFRVIDEILDEAPYYKQDGIPGLLATGSFGEYVREKLPLFDVSDIKDSALLFALYRDYSFLTSMYLLEPCHLYYIATEQNSYGLGRNKLPANIAVPFTKLAKKLGAKPFIEYSSYALYNWQKIDPSGNFDPNNLKVIRHFQGSKHETGFIAVHVAMEEYSGELVSNVQDILIAVQKQDRKAFNQAAKVMQSTMKKINIRMDFMWEQSAPKQFNNFRTYLMGTKNQPMFPKGVIYEGVSEEPQFYCGSSGANDSIIPTIDNLLELTEEMPDNPFTNILKEFRSYRPIQHNQYLSHIEQEAKNIGVRSFALQESNSTVLYQALLDQVSDFREKHWRITKNYVLKYSKHPRATGGSPIITWLPNQLATVMQCIVNNQNYVVEDDLTKENKKLYEDLNSRAQTQLRVLRREVEELKMTYPDQDLNFQTVVDRTPKRENVISSTIETNVEPQAANKI